MVQLSVLIMGAAGRSGQALIKHFLLENKKREEEEDENDKGNNEEEEQSANKEGNALESTKDSNTDEKFVEEIRIHAFCRSRQQLSKEILSEVDVVIEGDALNKEDVQRALIDSNADYVVVSIGQGNFLGKGTVRTDTAYAIASTIRDGSRFDKVKVIVLSAVGAGGSKISLGWGRGAAISYLMKNVFEDHSGQEREFLLLDTKESTSLAAQAVTNNATAENDNASTDSAVELDDSIYNAGSIDDMSSDEEDCRTEKRKPKEESGNNSKDTEVQEATTHMESISEDAKTEIQDANATRTNENSRVMIVRLTGLTDRDRTGNIVTFKEHERCPSAFISRADVAQYVYKRIVNNATRHEKLTGIVNITGGT